MSDKLTAKDAILSTITMNDLGDVALFLHHHMNSRFTPEVWQKGINKSWLSDTPNYGFMLKFNGEIVGVLCAVYSEQYLADKWVRICNPHSWCVLPDFRVRSIDLVLATIRQKNFSYTMFSPNTEGIEIFKYLKFKPLNNEVSVLFNTPSIGGTGQVETLQEMKQAEAHLPEKTAKCLADHIEFPWLNFLLFNENGKYGFLIYKKDIYKKLACSWIMYVSDEALFRRCWANIRTFLLFKHGMFTSKIESRMLGQPMKTWLKPVLGNQKLYLSDELPASCIHNIYSELVTLDL